VRNRTGGKVQEAVHGCGRIRNGFAFSRWSAEGWIGELRSMRYWYFSYFNGMPATSGTFRRTAGGGALLDIGCIL
jgi:hypothetical protein